MRPLILLAGLVVGIPVAASPASQKFDPEVVQHGRTEFRSSCGFCHGQDAEGNRAPDLIRSTILNHDLNGSLLRPLIRNGRPEKGMPAFPNLSEREIADIVGFLHYQAYAALNSGDVPGNYPITKLLTGSADRGRVYFNGAGGCTACHSVTGDLAGVARKYQPIELQQSIVYPKSRLARTAEVVTPDGAAYQGVVKHSDEFTIAITTSDGEYHSWLCNKVKIKIIDPLQAHRDLTAKYTDADMHDLFAYLETLK